MTSSQSPRDVQDVGCSDEERFQLELEFVQCLANPHYVNHLAQNRYFEDPAFVNYLHYLLYWKQPKYAKYIVYPHALFFLDALQDPEFRRAMVHSDFKEFVHKQQYFYWRFHQENVAKEVLAKAHKKAAMEPSHT
mmetsp:Transcript_1178/g.7658  ORF Transcript_1178/g.7658 Transcript_1178/m.7658 type:complete len:135 (-) Transcript_1178:5678-6082(-)|eukprot:CAMPEP_0113922802 /NCGR_PEP_ID=MMETSP1159-20121227/1804_1 /TAXON_ID=88271 /ORGANISM="Picocystis salinarum" /LENGTH=134 /DNA_ID=CAMNT_0000922929 /DNA_START=142 /DNA_END=546 /DNA_ORIENTATION=+ /assembly_acc=CAM_ASM_000767